MANQPGNQTPDTPSVSETELREMTVDGLRQEAKKAGISGAHGMNKEELVHAVANVKGSGGTGRDGRGQPGADADAGAGQGRNAEQGDDGDAGAGPDGGKIRKGPDTSKSLKYSQEVTSPDDEPEREGRSLVTTHHEVIKQWAEARNATPATVSGTEHGDHLGVLRFDFGGDSEDLRHVSWDEWFKTFDDRRLNFIYQEQRSDGQQSNFFRFDNPDREDA